ncbi:MAG TPA: glycosyltransferase family 1 protein [Candidatus Krumholzibacteria bacterium]|nr:glycosyltransferase family 1 protein [Candidatus Krumholzibacteria bacterium]
MRIVLPALQVTPDPTGVGVYTRELVRGWSQVAPGDLELVVLAPHPECFGFLPAGSGIEVRHVRLWREDAWGRMVANHTIVSHCASTESADVVLAPNFVAPLTGSFERAVMVHDLAFRRHPETTTWAKRTYYRTLVRKSIRRSARVLVSTRTVADEIEAWMPDVGPSIRIAPEGVSPTFLAHEDEENPRPEPIADRRRDLLFVGTLEPRKNLVRILSAHGNLCRHDATFPSLRLVGGKGWRDAAIERALADHSDPSRVRRLGYLTTEQLRDEYDKALGLLFCSLYEGFGLPILEAMTRGCPVITSRGTATEEVAGGAALLVDPVQTGEIENAMARLVGDRGLRRSLAERGRSRAREFSWSRCAGATIEALREIRPGRRR